MIPPLRKTITKPKRSPSVVIGWGVITLGIYAILFLLMYPVIGGAILVLSLIPIVTFAWMLGTTSGILAGVLMLFANIALLQVVNVDDWVGVIARGMIGNITLVFIGGGVGWLSELLSRVRAQSVELDNERAALEDEIIERRRAEEILIRSERRFRDLFESSPDAIIVEDHEGHVLDVNPAACTLHNMTHELIFQADLKELLRPNEMTLEEVLALKQPRFDGISFTKGGREIPVEVQVNTIDFAGSPANLFLIRDMTHQKRVQEALAVAFDQALEASRIKSELLAIVSHELRTPLNAIMGFSEIIGEKIYGPLTEKQEGAIHQITTSTEYLLDLVNQLLDQAQIEAGKLRLNISRFSIRDTAEKVYTKLKVLADTKSIALTLEVDEAVPPELQGDPTRIDQILINLVNNAIKFTDKGGVTIKVSRPDLQHWSIAVSDSGTGISDEDQKRIYEPFGQADTSETRKHRGTGLGLAIVKELTALMGGSIDLQSKLGVGTTFTITLPIEAEEVKND